MIASVIIGTVARLNHHTGTSKEVLLYKRALATQRKYYKVGIISCLMTWN